MLLQIAFFVFLMELVLTVFCFFLMCCFRIASNRKKERQKVVGNQLSQVILISLQNKASFNSSILIKNNHNFEDILFVLEAFDRRIADDFWQTIKDSILQNHLLPKAKKMIHSFSWIQRNLAIRCIALNPKLAGEQIIIPFLSDPKYIIRSTAASCAVQIGTEKLIHLVLEKTCQETPLARYPFRDALIQGGPAIFSIIKEIAAKETNPKIRALILDVLSTKVQPDLMPLIIKEIRSKDHESKLAAIKILANFPRDDAANELMYSLNDENSDVRAEASKSLGNISAKQSIPNLSKLLIDPEWWVRLQAALALKKLGSEGKNVLLQQDPDINLQAYDVAHYVLKLP